MQKKEAAKGREGGAAKRRALRERAGLLLSLPAGSGEDMQRLREAGLAPKYADNGALVALALFNKAKCGDISAIKEMVGWLGEEDTGGDAYLSRVRALLDGVQRAAE